RVIEERNTNNTPTTVYALGPDLSGTMEGAGGIGGILARSSGYSSGSFTSHAYYHADGNGNITYLEDSSQDLAASYVYDSYGNAISSYGSLASANTHRFSSKEYMAGPGLYYYLYRFYDPSLERWPNRDPIEEEGGLNLYAYVDNNPVNEIDPLGLIEEGAAELAAEPTLLMDNAEIQELRAAQNAKKAADACKKAKELKDVRDKED